VRVEEDQGQLGGECPLPILTELGGLIGDAQLLRAGPESWKQLPRELVQHLLMVALRWAEVEGHDLQVPLPAKLQRGSLLPSRTRLRLSELLLWVLTGLITEEERKAILAARS